MINPCRTFSYFKQPLPNLTQMFRKSKTIIGRDLAVQEEKKRCINIRSTEQNADICSSIVKENIIYFTFLIYVNTYSKCIYTFTCGSNFQIGVGVEHFQYEQLASLLTCRAVLVKNKTYTISYRYYLLKKYQAAWAAACRASSPSTSRVHFSIKKNRWR